MMPCEFLYFKKLHFSMRIKNFFKKKEYFIDHIYFSEQFLEFNLHICILFMRNDIFFCFFDNCSVD